MTAEQATQLNNFWYVAAQSIELKSRPLERKINGQTLVLFRDNDDTPHALNARC
ncbi:MAG: aromatic ring-hydroxylating dioxygenase subunit alpha, partial [Deltaproteobacteria bacterium]|nr:aromatic ring-hydroxylating dioxygenase subunit alpha [Deltaproteobacteria bacterium]